MVIQLKPERAIVPIVRAAREQPVKEILGTGFFVGLLDEIHVVTAKHVFEDNRLAHGEKYAIVLAGETGISIIAISTVRVSPEYDLAVCTVPRHLLRQAVILPVSETDVPLNEDVFSYEYSSSRIERTASGVQVSMEPYAHKGNVVRMYVSSFPEKLPTPSLLTSFPALQGASGAPVLAAGSGRKSFAVVGMLVANFERHLLPAQVVKIEEGSSYSETTSYFLPYGKALGRAAILQTLDGMRVPYTSEAV